MTRKDKGREHHKVADSHLNKNVTKAMKKIITLTILLLLLLPVRGQVAIGRWRDHLSFTAAKHVEPTTKRVYGSGTMGMFYYDVEEMTLNVMSKTTGLTDVGIATFAHDAETGYLVIAYSNGNIDLVREDKVYNISDIKRASIDGDKSIFHIRFDKRRAYLACSFGIVVIDLTRHEIENTYYLNRGGNRSAVRDIAFHQGKIIAGTENGLVTAARDDAFLNIESHWTWDTESTLAGFPIEQLESDGERLVVLTYLVDPNYKMIFVEQGKGNYALFTEGDIRSIRHTGNSWVVLKKDTLSIYDKQLQVKEQMTNIGGYDLQASEACIDDAGRLWVAHSWMGLLQMPEDRSWAFSLTPNGPSTSSAYRLVANGHSILLCPGGKTTTFSNAYQPAELCSYTGGKWSNLEDPRGLKESLRDIVDVAVDPRDSTHLLAAAWGYGIADIRHNTLNKVFTDTNTQGALSYRQEGTFKTLLTGAVAYDDEGNAWVTNSMHNRGLVCYGADGSWKTYNIAPMMESEGQFDHIVWDSVRGYKWFYGNKLRRIYVHDGVSKQAYVDPNHGSKLETNAINALVQDRLGEIWIGTNKGLKVIYDSYKMFNNGGVGEASPVNCSNIIISAEGIDEYLMAYENITCIAVDGANRKWVGTSTGGLYLLSPTGLEELAHFTTSNSPLYSDKIVSLAIQPYSGEVFIGSDKGVQSYRSTATWADEVPSEEGYAFPNPVRSGYEGPIAIKGLTRDGLVHITDAAGHVVYATQALGGQAIWYGRNMDGRRVGSGTYYVFSANEKGDFKSVTKILIIR